MEPRYGCDILLDSEARHFPFDHRPAPPQSYPITSIRPSPERLAFLEPENERLKMLVVEQALEIYDITRDAEDSFN